MTPTRIGVTGATGQVGSRLLRHLRAAGFEVVAVVRNPLGAALCDAVAPDVEIRVGPLTPDEGQTHVLDDCDVIVNCAIESSGGIPRQAYTRNRGLVDGLPPRTLVAYLPQPVRTARRVNEVIDAARGRGITALDVRPAARHWRGSRAPDLFHPNERGYARIAGLFADAAMGLGYP